MHDHNTTHTQGACVASHSLIPGFHTPLCVASPEPAACSTESRTTTHVMRCSIMHDLSLLLVNNDQGALLVRHSSTELVRILPDTVPSSIEQDKINGLFCSASPCKATHTRSPIIPCAQTPSKKTRRTGERSRQHETEPQTRSMHPTARTLPMNTHQSTIQSWRTLFCSAIVCCASSRSRI